MLVLVFLWVLMVFRILRILAGISQLIMMSGQKLQVKHRSKCTQELSPGSAPNKPAIQALAYRECLWHLGWPGLGCAALRVRIWVSQRTGMSWQHSGKWDILVLHMVGDALGSVGCFSILCQGVM